MPQVIVKDSVKQTLKRWKQEKSSYITTRISRSVSISVVGWLVGESHQDTIQVWHLVGNSPFTNQSDNCQLDRILVKDIGFYTSALPGPHIQLLGPIYVSHSASKVDTATETLSYSLKKAQSMFHLETFCSYNLEEELFYIRDPCSKLWITVDCTTLLETCVERNWYCFCAQLKLPYLFSGQKKDSHDSENDCQQLWKAFENRMEFLIAANNNFKLLRQCQELDCEHLAKSIGLSPIRQLNVVDIRILEKYIQMIPILCRYSFVSKEKATSGVTLGYERQENCVMQTFSLQVCCLLYSQDRMEVLLQSLENQLYSQFKYLTIVVEELQLEWKIFKPTSLMFPVMCLLPYPNRNGIEIHEEMRRKYHEAFQLDISFPYFRFALSLFSWKEMELMDTSHLFNVHRKIWKKSSLVSQNEIQRLVKGSYQYFHYMQDGIQDKGWGCAYRSLQTIISWFLLQGYTDKSIPTHREIQEMLVEIGDKETTFIASKQWIGATEVCYILQHYLGVESKILFVSSGAQMNNYARQIIQHFEQESTPVMIGGGVLAYTLLGIEYNESTGKVQYLILDPHYIGEDNLEVIIQKNWCGWKDSNIFQRDAFYNLCMPMRPKNVV